VVVIWHYHSVIQPFLLVLYFTGVAPPNLEVSSVTDEIVAVPKVTTIQLLDDGSSWTTY
jgi:hypothetical protein